MRLFAGRINRSTYLLATLFTALVAIVWSRPEVERFFNDHPGDFLLIALLFVVPLMVWQFAVAVRRVHDVNLSGWWALLVVLPGVQLVLLLIPGTKGPNAYGPQPTEPLDLTALLTDKHSVRPD